MKLLLLTFYYPPDLSAGSYRASALVDALVRAGGNDLEIDVATTMPNRYSSYKAEAANGGLAAKAVDDTVTTHRFGVPVHRSGLADQSLSFAAFSARVIKALRNNRYDVVVATSSRLFTGYLGALLARRCGAPLYLDIRDIFLDTARDLLKGRSMRALTPALSRVERFTIESAARVNLVSDAFGDYFEHEYRNQSFSYISNGVDPEFLQYDFRKPDHGNTRNEKKIMLYAGNIGLGQGIEHIVPQLAARLGVEFELRVIGDGGRRAVLERRLRKSGVDNVSLIPPIHRESLMAHYKACDYLLVHLNDFPALQKVLPSKIFEYAATGKPILAGLRGYSKAFVETYVDNAATFAPGDVDGCVDGLRRLSPGARDRRDFKQRFARDRIMAKMAGDILSLAAGRNACVRRGV